MKRIFQLALNISLLSLMLLGFAQSPQLATKQTLTLETAKVLSAAAEGAAEANGWTVAVAIVDDGGHLVHFVKRDGTQYASVEIALRKAQTAIGFKRPSGIFGEIIADGGTAILGLDVLPLQGGLPIEVDGQIVGAIGVSGVQSSEDVQVAQAALDALAARLE